MPPPEPLSPLKQLPAEVVGRIIQYCSLPFVSLLASTCKTYSFGFVWNEVVVVDKFSNSSDDSKRGTTVFLAKLIQHHRALRKIDILEDKYDEEYYLKGQFENADSILPLLGELLRTKDLQLRSISAPLPLLYFVNTETIEELYTIACTDLAALVSRGCPRLRRLDCPFIEEEFNPIALYKELEKNFTSLEVLSFHMFYGDAREAVFEAFRGVVRANEATLKWVIADFYWPEWIKPMLSREISQAESTCQALLGIPLAKLRFREGSVKNATFYSAFFNCFIEQDEEPTPTGLEDLRTVMAAYKTHLFGEGVVNPPEFINDLLMIFENENISVGDWSPALEWFCGVCEEYLAVAITDIHSHVGKLTKLLVKLLGLKLPPHFHDIFFAHFRALLDQEICTEESLVSQCRVLHAMKRAFEEIPAADVALWLLGQKHIMRALQPDYFQIARSYAGVPEILTTILDYVDFDDDSIDDNLRLLLSSSLFSWVTASAGWARFFESVSVKIDKCSHHISLGFLHNALSNSYIRRWETAIFQATKPLLRRFATSPRGFFPLCSPTDRPACHGFISNVCRVIFENDYDEAHVLKELDSALDAMLPHS